MKCYNWYRMQTLQGKIILTLWRCYNLKVNSLFHSLSNFITSTFDNTWGCLSSNISLQKQDENSYPSAWKQREVQWPRETNSLKSASKMTLVSCLLIRQVLSWPSVAGCAYRDSVVESFYFRLELDLKFNMKVWYKADLQLKFVLSAISLLAQSVQIYGPFILKIRK